MMKVNFKVFSLLASFFSYLCHGQVCFPIYFLFVVNVQAVKLPPSLERILASLIYQEVLSQKNSRISY